MATIPKPATPKRDDRFEAETSEDNRSSFQRDRDRILYTSAFQRLGGITQVASADEGHVFHNRLTHTLEVAQVARRIAERLNREYPQQVAKVGGIDADVAESCALAHDLGHPPFGHIAEKELNKLLLNKEPSLDGFEGNVQSFRIVTKLALRSDKHDGLNLTRATLNGILKYPWTKPHGRKPKTTVARNIFEKRTKKWGAYRTESDQFLFARGLSSRADDRQSFEAQIMDWADDLTYAIHDVSDFFKAGLLPLDRLAVDPTERARFYNEVFSDPSWNDTGFSNDELRKAFDTLCQLLPTIERYAGTKKHRIALRRFGAGMIGQCVRGVKIDIEKGKLYIPPELKKEIAMLKQLTWRYVILNPSLTTKQVGQRKIIHDLFETFHTAAVEAELDIFPAAYRELVKAAGSSRERARLVTDMIAGMTEQQAINIHRKLTGINLGSVLDPITR